MTVIEEKVSYCRICEALCGVIATVEDGRITKVRGDELHPVSKGYLCPKGAAVAKLLDDPDRVVEPLRRVGGPGEFAPVSWDEALDDIATRLNAIRRQHGPHAIAMYFGNPSAFSLSHIFWAKGFFDAIGSRNYYSAGPQDTFGRQSASAHLYGSSILFPIPDIPRSSFVLIAGANPLVSHGSLITLPRIRDELAAVVARGGRVVVVDPVATKTAKAFEHVVIKPGTDTWLFAAMVHVLFAEGRVDRTAVSGHVRGLDSLEAALARFTPEAAAVATGIDAPTIRSLALAFDDAPTAVAYGRVGLCRNPHATLANVLLDALNIVSGNFDRAGGWMFGDAAIDFVGMAAKFGLAADGRFRTRIGDLPDISGQLPWVLPDEIATPGPEQVRALITSAGNPVLSAPDGAALEAGLRQLELVVALDHYVTETTRHAHYILPAPSFFEREDFPVTFLGHMPKPFVQTTKAVVPPPPGVREEWEVYDELARRMGLGGPFGQRPARWIARALRVVGQRVTPRLLTDLLLRISRRGLSLRKLEAQPHGVALADGIPEAMAPKKIQHKDKLVHLDAPTVLAALRDLPPEGDAGSNGHLLLVGRRDLRSINSWLHNVRGPGTEGEPTLWVNPDDAARAGLVDRGRAHVKGPAGAIDVLVKVTTDVGPGTVCYPHGWGHAGGWRTANSWGGANVNRLATTTVADKDPLSGASHLDGIPVEVVAAS